MEIVRKGEEEVMKINAESNRMRVLGKGVQSWLDPLRLKILIIPYKEANPIGKNADYFFLKGFKYAAAEDYANAINEYKKGLEIKYDHLLCRFNLGAILFKLGLFEEALSQYELLLTKDSHLKKPQILFNRTMCLFQLGRYQEVLSSAQLCLDTNFKDESLEAELLTM